MAGTQQPRDASLVHVAAAGFAVRWLLVVAGVRAADADRTHLLQRLNDSRELVGHVYSHHHR